MFIYSLNNKIDGILNKAIDIQFSLWSDAQVSIVFYCYISPTSVIEWIGNWRGAFASTILHSIQ